MRYNAVQVTMSGHRQVLLSTDDYQAAVAAAHAAAQEFRTEYVYVVELRKRLNWKGLFGLRR